MAKKKTIDLEEILGSQMKAFMGVYSALHHGLLAVVKDGNSELMTDCFNNVIAVVLHEVGLVNVTEEELRPYEDEEMCRILIDEKVRLAKTITALFLTKLLEEKTVEEFKEQIDTIGEALRKRLGQDKVVH